MLSMSKFKGVMKVGFFSTSNSLRSILLYKIGFGIEKEEGRRLASKDFAKKQI